MNQFLIWLVMWIIWYAKIVELFVYLWVFFLFPLFTPFRRKSCYAGTSLSQVGVCYTAYQCTLRGGVASGTCANGRGVCCVFQYSCDGVSTAQNYTYFTSPGYPASYTGGSRCSITVTKANFSVCQLRINMLDLTLAPPTAEGVCSDDFMSSSSSTLRLCGDNKGQHIYVDFRTASSFTLSVDTNSLLSFDRSWNMEIIQIPCSSGVPSGCTQFYNTTSGSVSSFNYGTTASTSTNTDGSAGNRQIAGLNYGVCVRSLSGYCYIEWSQNSASPYSFTVSGPTDALDTSVLGNASAATSGGNCTTNFVVIPNPSQNGVRVSTDRFCGNGFVATTSAARPYVLYVTTAATSSTTNSGDLGNRGFTLNYRLLPC
ncbi:uncharacterized protein LOC128995570 [Macrosteles quadrilineatus]|uniref:uncharacterized protein LOC128995570 n=1 Tax=Macrosteles quadrilineatus TaxID=74068 RepID=UPI0023E0D377|nr:uncharacterized protein LOC128995570 [Macrosteles quadrilineatus]